VQCSKGMVHTIRTGYFAGAHGDMQCKEGHYVLMWQVLVGDTTCPAEECVCVYAVGARAQRVVCLQGRARRRCGAKPAVFQSLANNVLAGGAAQRHKFRQIKTHARACAAFQHTSAHMHNLTNHPHMHSVNCKQTCYMHEGRVQ